MTPEPNFAKVHRLPGEMRRKLTQQSIAGIAQADRETNYLVDENGEYFQ